MQIFVMKDEDRLGPFSLEDINQKLAAGQLNPSDQAWFEGSPGWRVLLSIPGVILPGAASSTARPLSIAISATTKSTSYGGFWLRTLAYVIDTLILVVVVELIVQVAKVFLPNVDLLPLAAFVLVAGNFIYMALLWSTSNQATIGQKVCRLKVVDAVDGGRISFLRATGRWFALLVAMSILFAGVIMVAFTERKRGLQDILASTHVVKEFN